MGRFLALHFSLAATGLLMGVSLMGLAVAAWHGAPTLGFFVLGLLLGVMHLGILWLTLWLERPEARQAGGLLGFWARKQRPEKTPAWLVAMGVIHLVMTWGMVFLLSITLAVIEEAAKLRQPGVIPAAAGLVGEGGP